MSAGLLWQLVLLAISLTFLLLPEETGAVPEHDTQSAEASTHPFHARPPTANITHSPHNDSRTTSPKMSSIKLSQCESGTSKPFHDICFVTHYTLAATHGGGGGVYKYFIDKDTGVCTSSIISGNTAFGSVACSGSDVYVYQKWTKRVAKYDFFTNAGTYYNDISCVDSLGGNVPYLFTSMGYNIYKYTRSNMDYETVSDRLYEANIEDVNDKSTVIFTETVSHQIYQFCYLQSSAVCRYKTTEVGPFAILNNDNVLAVHEDGSIRTGYLNGNVHTLEGDINDDINTDKITILSVTHSGEGQPFMAVNRWNGKGTGNTFEVYMVYET